MNAQVCNFAPYIIMIIMITQMLLHFYPSYINLDICVFTASHCPLHLDISQTQSS